MMMMMMKMPIRIFSDTFTLFLAKYTSLLVSYIWTVSFHNDLIKSVPIAKVVSA